MLFISYDNKLWQKSTFFKDCHRESDSEAPLRPLTESVTESEYVGIFILNPKNVPLQGRCLAIII